MGGTRDMAPLLALSATQQVEFAMVLAQRVHDHAPDWKSRLDADMVRYATALVGGDVNQMAARATRDPNALLALLKGMETASKSIKPCTDFIAEARVREQQRR
jgi:hypothetical protein